MADLKINELEAEDANLDPDKALLLYPARALNDTDAAAELPVKASAQALIDAAREGLAAYDAQPDVSGLPRIAGSALETGDLVLIHDTSEDELRAVTLGDLAAALTRLNGG